MSEKILGKINRKSPIHLYHYTNLDSLIGIVSNNEFWLSNLYFQNDKQEYEIGLNYFKKYLVSKKKEFKDNPKNLVFLNSLDSAISHLELHSHIYTLSLSEEPDLLSQWRGYADNCRGTRLQLTSLEKLKANQMQLLPCLYSEEEHIDYVAHIYNTSIKIFNETKEEGKTDKKDFSDYEKPFSDAILKAGQYFLSTVNVACAIIKNRSFSEEKEWRLINFTKPQVFFRSRSHYVIPYIKMNMPDLKNILTEVMICSTPEREVTQKSIQYLLNNKGFHSTSISNSTIPYRL
ncbi:DUF2971 domain-containing protein [Flavobacterium anhuiense]|uniref:DUF2971 domain-containing protein n=1 Tax=Flavobacterium anhuiense TaxID=459526 RepID=UPI003D96BFE7